MPDIRYINSREKKEITLDSKRDNGYNELILPYNFQNVDADNIVKNTKAIVEEISKGIKGINELKWIRAINKEFVNDELDKTFEHDVLDNYGELIQEYYGLGNWDLTLKPKLKNNVSLSDKGYVVNNDSILNPQYGLYWNSFYNKYFAVWYTPYFLIPDDEEKRCDIISKSDAESYIKNVLSKSTSYIINDTKGIILRATDELGFSPIDTMSVGRNPTVRVNNLISGLRNWVIALDDAQNTYQALKKLCSEEKLKQEYLFIDEDKNYFNSLNKSYFVFNIEKGYYADLFGTNDITEPPEYWDKDTDYKTGDYVMGIGKKNKNYIYRCALGYKAEETDHKFNEKIEVTKKLPGSNQTYQVLVDQWVLVSRDYAKEINAIEEAFADLGETFNQSDWVRFVFPALEDKYPIEYYPSGEPKPNSQYGLIYWGAENGITLRPIQHKYIKEEDEDKDPVVVSIKTTYLSKALSEFDETDPLDPYITSHMDTIDYSSSTASPSQSSYTFIDSSRKIIHYFKKSQMPLTFYVSLECKIRAIKDEAFSNRADLLKVILHSHVNSIGNMAFYNCNNLIHAILPRDLEGMGIKAFAACTSLKRASIPERVSRLNAAYIGCINLQSVVLSNNMMELGDSTFTNCKSLKYVYNTSNIKKLGSSVFNGCEELKHFTIPEAVTELPARLFKNCKNAEIIIKNTAPTFIGESCFEGCEKIEEPLSFKNVEVLYKSTYKNCTHLKRIIFDYNSELEKKPVPESFCYGCHRLKTIDLRQVTEIQDKAFQNCAMLSQVDIPSTVETIGENIFYDCFRLGRVRVPTEHPKKEGSWIENVLNSINISNWVDPMFTIVTNYSGKVIKWQYTMV